MWRRIRFVLTLLGLASAAALGTPVKPVHAAAPGYTLITSFSADSENPEYTASFAPDVLSIYAWAMIAADSGAPDKEFQVDVQFFSPVGQKVGSDWFEGDTGKIRTGPAATFISTAGVPAENVARRQLDLAFTAYEKLTGQWTAVFSIDGRIAVVESFTVATASELAAEDSIGEAKRNLEQQGYVVLALDSFVGEKNNQLYGRLKMTMASPSFYSAETSRQMMDGFAAIRSGIPNAKVLALGLEYESSYELWYFILADNWDEYVKTKNYALFVKTLVSDVYSKDENKWLGAGTKDFMSKSFGAGPPPLPVAAPGLKQSSVGSIRIQAAPLSLPTDGAGSAQINVTVYDKKNMPMANAPVTFRLSGTGAATIDPRAARTAGLGQAAVTFRPGKKDGAMVMTAANGTTNASIVLNVRQGSKDTAADNVYAYVSAQGYTATDVSYDRAKSAARAVVDLGATFDMLQVPSAILDATVALREYYPDAATLQVALVYRRLFWLVFSTSSANVDQLLTSINEAGGERARVRSALQNYLNPLFDKAVVVDTRSGKPIGIFKDLLNKNFGG